MLECEGLLTETLPGAFVCSNGGDCLALPWLLSAFSTGGRRVSERVRSSHENHATLPAHQLAESWEISEAILNAFELLAEDILDQRKPALLPYVLLLVRQAAKHLGDDPIGYLVRNRLDAASS